MKFSVLMSLYAKEKPQYLAECFESLTSQTQLADEIILVFDGAITDELEMVVQKYQKCLPLVEVRLPKNMGLGNALNEGLKHCHYDWVFRMDTDDICVPERFEKQVNFIAQNPDTIIFGGQIAEFGEHIQDIVSYRRVPCVAEEIQRFSQKRCPFNHMTVAYQRKAVLDVGGYEDLQEDYYLWIKLIAKYKKVANLSDILVYARIGNGMVGRRRGMAQAKAEWNIFKLKMKLDFQSPITGIFIFLFRMISRFMPLSLLSKIYSLFLRK